MTASDVGSKSSAKSPRSESGLKGLAVVVAVRSREDSSIDSVTFEVGALAVVAALATASCSFSDGAFSLMACATGRVLPPRALVGGTFRDEAIVTGGG